MLALLVPLGDDAAILHGGRRPAVNDDSALEDQIGLPAGGFIVTLLLEQMSGQIRFQVIVHQGTARLHSLLQIDHCLQRFHVHDDVFDCVFGDVAALGDDHGDRLARMSNLVFDQRNLAARIEHDILGGRRRRNQRGPRLPIVAHIFGREDGNHARSLAGGAHIKAEQAGVGVVTAQEGGVQQTGDFHIVHELGLPGQQAGILVSQHALSDECLGH